MARTAMKFFRGYPYISNGGISYDWAHEDKDRFNDEFFARKEEVGNYLLERAKSYLPTPNGKSVMYPRLHHGPEIEVIHTDTNCACMSFGRSSLGTFVSFHNVDASKQQSMGFNLSSDLVEYLDGSFLAPRINLDESESSVVYPLPSDSRMLSLDDPNYLARLRGLSRRFTNFTVDINNASLQRLVFPTGRVEITRESCIAYGFEDYDLVNVTYFIARLSDWCSRAV